MFSLGNKEAIVNSTAKYPVVVDDPKMTIEGFGTFDKGQIIGATAQRFIPSSVGSLEITVPSAAELGILDGEVNVPVVVHIRVNTTRHSSEWAIDFIKRGRPFIFELMVNGLETPADIVAKLETAFAEYELKFNMSNNGLPWTWASGANGLTTLTLKSPYLSFQSLVDLMPKGQTYGIKAVTAKTGLIQEPIFDGKYLEENVRMSLATTSDSYGISPDEKPVISGSYTAITFTAINDLAGGGIDSQYRRHKFLGTTRGERGGDREFSFTLYMLEGTDMFDAGGKVQVILDFIDTTLDTPALIMTLADGTPVATATLFIA